MKMNPFHTLVLILLCLIGSGCTSSNLDFCSLLSLEEMSGFDADIVSSEMGVRGEEAPTQYCIYKNSKNDEVFLLSIGNPTKNLPYDILQTFSLYMDGTNSVEMVIDVGNSGAALFSDDYETDKFRILIANGPDWSVTVRAKGVDSMYSENFSTLKTLANKALSRFP